MPAGDRTGPMGQGPRTGRGAGYCSGADQPGFASAPGRRGWFGGWGGGGGGRGFGAGRGRGFGAGRGWGFGAARGWGGWAAPGPVAPEPQDTRTDSLLQRLVDRVEALEKRLAGLDRND